MVAVLRPELALIPMDVGWIDDVVEIERAAYPFPWTRGNFVDSLDAGYSAWMLLERGVLVGYSVFMLAVDDAHLLNLTVAPSHEGRGLGAWMLAQVSAIARSHRARKIFLEVRPSNARARRLYERAGFKLIGIRKGYYPDAGERREDALVLEVQL